MQHMDGNNIIAQLTGAKVSRMSQAYSVPYSHAVSHGDSLMCSELYFLTFFLDHRSCIKPSQTITNGATAVFYMPLKRD